MTKHIKLLSKDNVIVGVAEINENSFVCNIDDSLVRCEEEYAQGIISDDGSSIYQIEGKEPIRSGEDFLIAFLIDEFEYDCLLNQLDDPKEEVPDEIEDNEKESYMTAAQMRLKIKELTEELSKEKERNDMLEECIIEMSEIVYA